MAVRNLQVVTNSFIDIADIGRLTGFLNREFGQKISHRDDDVSVCIF